MRGVYLVAAELARHGFIASLTSRSARGADILATDVNCRRAFSIQVKTNAANRGFWLMGRKCKDFVSDSHIYVFVDCQGDNPELFIVPSKVVARQFWKSRSGKWDSFCRENALPYKNKWEIFSGGK